MRKMQRLLALMLALCLLAAVATAGASGLGDFVSYFLDVNDDVRFRAGVQLSALMPFDDPTVAQLNGVLKHLTLSAEIKTREDGSDTALSFASDGADLFTLEEAETADGAYLTTTLLPNRTLTGKGSVMDALFDDKADEAAFDALNAISEVKECYKALTDGIMPFAEEKKASYKIKNIGSARWGRIARLTSEQSAALLPQIAAVLGCGMDSDYREELAKMTCDNAFVVALYRDAEGGKDMAVYLKGNVTFADGSSRRLSYQWAFVDEGTERKDSYKYEMKTNKGSSDNRIISASYSQKKFTDRFTVDGKCTTTLKNPERTQVVTDKHALEGAQSGDTRAYKGTQSTEVKQTVDSKTTTITTTLTQDMKLTSAEGSGVLSGTVRVQRMNAKKALLDLTVAFDEAPAERLSAANESGDLYAVGEDAAITIIDPESGVVATQAPTASAQDKAAQQYEVGKAPVGYASYTAPDEAQTVSIDGISNAQLATLTDEMTQNLAGKLLLALAKLPEEDRALLSDGMTDEDFATFMALVKGL